MSNLNRIFYGPAGTGKTREAIKQAVEIVKQSSKEEDLSLSDFDTSTYNGTIDFFNAVSNLPELNISSSKLIDDIQNSEKDVDLIIKSKAYKGYLEDLDNPKQTILKHRLYPLIETVTFHPSYSYQDFVEGISAETNNTGDIKYIVKDGIFKKICKRAIDNPDYNYVLIIDEINRGDISSIFGELFTLLEDKKRLGENEELKINLPYSKDKKGNPEKLSVPKNLFIFATMNTVDKSIALIDIALRRRFQFIECMPKYEIKDLIHIDIESINFSKLLKTINKRISILKNEHYQIGHSYFLNVYSLNDVKEVFIKRIIPLLQEYFYDDWQSICAILNQSYNSPEREEGILISSDYDYTMFKDEFDELIEFRNKKIFSINENFTSSDIINIYE